jgi:hypothetical protein
MKHLDDSIKALFTPEQLEELERRSKEISESPDFKRFRYLGDRYYSGEATPEESEEYEARTEWRKKLPRSPIPGLIPDDHPLSMGGFPSTKYQPGALKEGPSADPGNASP